MHNNSSIPHSPLSNLQYKYIIYIQQFYVTCVQDSVAEPLDLSKKKNKKLGTVFKIAIILVYSFINSNWQRHNKNK